MGGGGGGGIPVSEVETLETRVYFFKSRPSGYWSKHSNHFVIFLYQALLFFYIKKG